MQCSTTLLVVGRSPLKRGVGDGEREAELCAVVRGHHEHRERRHLLHEVVPHEEAVAQHVQQRPARRTQAHNTNRVERRERAFEPTIAPRWRSRRSSLRWRHGSTTAIGRPGRCAGAPALAASVLLVPSWVAFVGRQINNSGR